MKYLFLLFSLFYCLFGCKSPKQNHQAAEKLDSVEFSLLMKKYNIRYCWDTIYFPYSIEYDDIIKAKHQLIKRAEIGDIYKKDSLTYVSLNTGDIEIFLFRFPVTTEQEMELRDTSFNFSFVVSIIDIKKISLVTNCENDDGELYIASKEGRSFYGKGEIKEIIKKKAPKYESD